MPPDPLSALNLAKLIGTHLATWLRNLARAKQDRQQESLRAVNGVVAALRMTQAYTRGLQAGERNHSTEGEMAAKWTELAYELERLGLDALAKKCDVSGRYWADPSQFDQAFLAQAGTDLAVLEKQARELQARIKSGQA